MKIIQQGTNMTGQDDLDIVAINKIVSEFNLVAKKYGFSVPMPNMLNGKHVVVGNISIYKGDYKKIMKDAFIELCSHEDSKIQ